MASVLGGGKFSNGAVTAAYGYIYNAISQSARARLILTGGVLGGAVGGTVALGCTAGTGGACAIGAPGLVGLGITGGASFGNVLANFGSYLDDIFFSNSGTGGNESEVKKPTAEAPYPNNPDNSDFNCINDGDGAKLNPEDGSVWDRDKSGQGNRDGDGSQWKRWPDKRSWEKGKTPNSILPDGRVRK
ncbi:hypothetical protein [Janthinobacterium agaricidamnosum]|uniref:hypothetical protein n=1 Tax=Janthinobacterium agaricidamnosum TaxID=55508 RepID=UPI000B076647|nr:hypothetical protein [Janthinobacterium agaricidamnosum]